MHVDGDYSYAGTRRSDSRAGTSMALSYATSDIGAHHTRAWTIAKEIEQVGGWSDEEKVEAVFAYAAKG